MSDAAELKDRICRNTGFMRDTVCVGPEKSMLMDPLNCKTDVISDEQRNETRFTDTKADEQECDVTIKSAAPVDHEKSTWTDSLICKTGDTSDKQTDRNHSTIMKADEQDWRQPEVTLDEPHRCRRCRYLRLHPGRYRYHHGFNRKVDHSQFLGTFFKQTESIPSFFPVSQISFPGMGEWQNTPKTKQKQKLDNETHAHRSQLQLMLQARELNNKELNGGVDKKINEVKYDDLTDGVYEKLMYVKTWKGNTITVKINLKNTMDTVKGQIEEKTKIPKEHQHLVSRGRVLMDKSAEGLQHKWRRDYRHDSFTTRRNKNKSLSPTPMNIERKTKRKASEPYNDVSGLEDEKFESAASEEETVTTKQWTKSMMNEIKDRTVDISEVEKTMTGMTFEMEEVKVNMNKMADAFSKIVDESQRRDHKFGEIIKLINEDIRAQDQKKRSKNHGNRKPY